MRRTLSVALLVATAPISGCYSSTVHTLPLAEEQTDRRTPLVAGSPLSIDWRRAGQTFIGDVKWARCKFERSWTSGERRFIERTPLKPLGGVLLAAGLTMVTIAAHGGPEKTVTEALPAVLYFTGVGFASVGAETLFWAKPHTKVQVTEGKLERSEAVAPCAHGAANRGLKLALKLEDGRGFAGVVDSSATVRIALPADLELTPGSELPVVVVEVPEQLAGLVAPLAGRGHDAGGVSRLHRARVQPKISPCDRGVPPPVRCTESLNHWANSVVLWITKCRGQGRSRRGELHHETTGYGGASRTDRWPCNLGCIVRCRAGKRGNGRIRHHRVRHGVCELHHFRRRARVRRI
jgi:hypothetical protein